MQCASTLSFAARSAWGVVLLFGVGVAACNGILGNEERELAPGGTSGSSGSSGSTSPDGGPLVPIDGASPEGDATTPTDAGAEADADAAPVCPGAASCTRTVFVTSVTRDGAFGGIAAADALCQSLANASNHSSVKGRQFAAWLGVVGSSAGDRLVHGTGPYVRPDGQTVAANWTDLVDGSLLMAIARDESDTPQSGGVWTGVNVNGGWSSTVCGLSSTQPWQSASSSNQGQQGSATSVNGTWTDDGFRTCEIQGRFYCVEK